MLLNPVKVYEGMQDEKSGSDQPEEAQNILETQYASYKTMSPEQWFKRKNWAGNPFTFNIYPDIFVGYKEQASRIMLMLLEKHKFIQLSGPTGSGKTTLLKWVEEQLAGSYDVIFIGKSPENPEDFVLIFNEKFRERWPISLFRRGLKNVYQIQDFLNKKLKNSHMVIMIDEVHEANIETLEWLRVLGDQVNNVSFILSGLPVFDDLLMDKLETFRKRIVAKIELPSLTKEETMEMIKKRIQRAGGTGDEFSEDIIDFIHMKTGGFPREILRLCDEFVNNAIMQEKEELTAGLVGAAEAPTTTISMGILDEFTPMQKEIVEILSQKSLSPGQIANSLNLEKYKSRQHAVRSVNNILKMLLARGHVERKQSEKTFVYALTPKIKSLIVRA